VAGFFPTTGVNGVEPCTDIVNGWWDTYAPLVIAQYDLDETDVDILLDFVEDHYYDWKWRKAFKGSTTGISTPGGSKSVNKQPGIPSDRTILKYNLKPTEETSTRTIRFLDNS